MRTILITLALLSLSSCKLVMIKTVKKAKIFPNYASEKQINKFYNKYAATQTEYISLRDFSEMEKVQDTSQHLAQDTIIYNHLKHDYKNFDYTLIIYWSSWRGKFSGEILDFEKQFVLNNPELRIQVLKVNMDFREEMKGTWVNKWTIAADEYTSFHNELNAD